MYNPRLGDMVQIKNCAIWHYNGKIGKVTSISSNFIQGVSVQFTYPEYNFSDSCSFKYDEIVLYKSKCNEGLGYLIELERAIDLT